MESLKLALILCVFCTLLSLIYNQQTICDQRENQCVGKNPMPDLPLIQGRCCWNSQTCSCSYKEGIFVMNLNKIKGAGLSCGTAIEQCVNKGVVASKAYDTCYTIHTEIPFKCCYIRIGPQSFCYPLDVSNKEIYSIFEHKLRAKYNYDDPYVEIICNSSLMTFSFFIFLFSLFVYH